MSTVVINNPDHLLTCIGRKVEAVIAECDEMVAECNKEQPKSWWRKLIGEPAGYEDYPLFVRKYVNDALWEIHQLLVELKEGRVTLVTISSRLYAKLCAPHTRLICWSHCTEADPFIREMRAINIAEEYNVHYSAS